MNIFLAALLTLGYVFGILVIGAGAFYAIRWVYRVCEYLFYVLVHFLRPFRHTGR
ncbi:MAG: Uncharacterised protein [Rhodobiaceae bacterium UBA7378]|nr:MAG: Uncharacterised protein [Rhodobiaceae bacterium UBA7378]